MIELRTGLPGNGKTLSIVAEMAVLLQTWDRGSDQSRSIFTNIKGLALPVAPIPIKQVNKSKEGTETYVPDWEAMPDGSYVVFDEAQDFFPPRSSQSTAPPHVAWLNTHRHKGFDIVAITQHPKLVDPALRALSGKHKHYRRVFGMNRAIVYEWDGCSDNLSGMKNAVTTIWNFPKKAYQFYKSAEVHTKQQFKLPLWVGIPLIGLALGAYFVPKAYGTLSNGIQGKGLSASTASQGKAADGGKGGAIAPPAAASPQAKPTTVTVAQATVAPVLASPVRYVGCIANADQCKCLTPAGEVVESPDLCHESARSFGYLVNIANESSSVASSVASPATPGANPARQYQPPPDSLEAASRPPKPAVGAI